MIENARYDRMATIAETKRNIILLCKYSDRIIAKILLINMITTIVGVDLMLLILYLSEIIKITFLNFIVSVIIVDLVLLAVELLQFAGFCFWTFSSYSKVFPGGISFRLVLEKLLMIDFILYFIVGQCLTE